MGLLSKLSLTRRQALILIVLGIADCLVLGMLVLAVALTPRVAGGQRAAASPTPTGTPTPALPPTWTPTPTFTPVPTPTPRPTIVPTQGPTPTPFPTFTPTPIPPIEPVNGTFDQITLYDVPGWTVEAVVNWQPGEPYDPNNSYALPKFKYADDPRRLITGNTLQIESTDQYAKFQVALFQVVDVPAGMKARFEIRAKGYSDEGGIIVRAGIDPQGRATCKYATWGPAQTINQNNDVVALRSPQVTVGSGGKVTLCFFAQPEWAVAHKAAFFDDARVIVAP